jgi:hypothetical protein
MYVGKLYISYICSIIIYVKINNFLVLNIHIYIYIYTYTYVHIHTCILSMTLYFIF